MLEQKYFVTRLGDIYEYSRIQYRCGEGTSNQGQHYLWELCVDVSGNIIFVLHSKDFSQPLENLPQKIESFSGTSDNELWEINCTNVYILETNVDILETEVEASRKITYFCISDTIILKQKGQKLSAISLAKAYFSNLSFSSIDCERGFSVNINGKNLYFQILEHNKKIIKLIKIKRISDALLSTVSIPINQDEGIETIEAEIESMSWFLSLLNLNVISVPIIEYYSGDQIIQFSIKNTTKNNFNENYIIDNNRINEGIPKAINECYQNYKTWQSSIKLNILIDYLAEINQQKYIDLKLSAMLVAYEYLLTKYLINKNGSQGVPVNISIKDKLKRANFHLRFIPSHMMNDTIRDTVRNPLFHQGEIPLLSSDDKINVFKEYYNLLIKIVLKILGYTGNYISVVTHSPTDL